MPSWPLWGGLALSWMHNWSWPELLATAFGVMGLVLLGRIADLLTAAVGELRVIRRELSAITEVAGHMEGDLQRLTDELRPAPRLDDF